jgi:hypothetical protein
VENIGVSEEGRDIVLLVIADKKGIGKLNQLKAASAALAGNELPRDDHDECHGYAWRVDLEFR